MPTNLIFSNGKKFIWDGGDYPNGECSAEKMETYKKNGFEVEARQEDGKTYLYTRRVVKEAVVDKV